MVCCQLCYPVCLKLYLFYLQLYSLVCLQVIKANEGSSHITISLDPQPALIGEDVQIRCTLVQIPVLPRIAVNDKEETLQSLANREEYTTNSPITNGVTAYVLTLHNVSVSDNGTRFECFVRQHGSRITSGTRVLRVVHERITVTKVYEATSLQETSVLLTEIVTSQRASIQSSSSDNIHLLSFDKSEIKNATNTKSHQMTTSKIIENNTGNLYDTDSGGHVHSSTVIVASVCAIIGGIIVLIIIVSSVCLFVKAVKRTKSQSDRSTDSVKESSPAILEVNVATGPYYESIVQKGRRKKLCKSGRKVTEKSYENVPSDHISHHINSSRDHREGVAHKQNQGSTPQTAPNVPSRQGEGYETTAPTKKKRFVSKEETIEDLNKSLSSASPFSPEIKQTLNKKGYEVMEAVEEEQKEPIHGINAGGGCRDGDQYIELASVKKSKVTMRQPDDPMIKQPADPIVKQPADPIVKQPADPIVKQPADPMKQPVDPMMKQPADPMMKQPADLMMKKPANPMTKQPADPMMKQPADPRVVNDCIGCTKVGLKQDVSPRHSYEEVVLPQPPADVN